MKTIYLLAILQIAAVTLFAQNNELVNLQRSGPVNSMKDKQEYRGYTIRLLNLPVQGNMGRYGFDILENNKLVKHQFQNPLPFSLKGVQKKSDAYEIAKWMIREYKHSGHWQNIIPPHIAHELKIETPNLIQNN